MVLVDVSGSMTAPLSRRSEMQRTDAAYGLAVLLREIGEKVAVFSFSDWLVGCLRGADLLCATRSTTRSLTTARSSARLSAS